MAISFPFSIGWLHREIKQRWKPTGYSVDEIWFQQFRDVLIATFHLMENILIECLIWVVNGLLNRYNSARLFLKHWRRQPALLLSELFLWVRWACQGGKQSVQVTKLPLSLWLFIVWLWCLFHWKRGPHWDSLCANCKKGRKTQKYCTIRNKLAISDWELPGILRSVTYFTNIQLCEWSQNEPWSSR